MGIGTGFAHAFLGAANAKLPPEEAMKFRMQTKALGKMGLIGLVLLIISGLYLMMPYWAVLTSSPLLIAKLTLVLLLIVVIILISRAGNRSMATNSPAAFKKAEALGKLSLLIGLSIVTLAVFFFR